MPYSDLLVRKEYHQKYNKFWYLRRKHENTMTCHGCGQLFNSRYTKQMYCSIKCAGIQRKNSVHCIKCGKAFFAPPSKCRKFCSQSCSAHGRDFTKTKLATKYRNNNKLVSILRSERKELNRNWKGDKTKYSGIHMWIYNNFKKTNICTHCNKEGGTQWANTDHKYSRDATYWLELCPKCHTKYDKVHNHK